MQRGTRPNVDGCRPAFGRGRRTPRFRRHVSPLAAALLLAAAPLALAQDQEPAPGALVGQLELIAPDVSPFVLHGTLPLPRGIYPRADGLGPFVLRDAAGERYDAQVEVVSRYASAASGADVVELLARVAVPPGVQPGSFTRYDVVYWPHAVQPFEGAAAVDELLATATNLRLRTCDVFGHEYAAQPLNNINAGWRTRTLRDGSVAVQKVTHVTLLPHDSIGGPQGTLPHMMGVHCYITRWSKEPFFSLDLRVHNAHSGLDEGDPTDDALGRIYFRSLELRLPRAFVLLPAFEDPTFGPPRLETENGVEYAVWPIIAPLADGTMNVLPQLAQLNRRFVVALRGSEARAEVALREEGLGFCQPGTAGGHELYSWWNPETARYFPQKHVLPTLDHVGLPSIRVRLRNDFQAIAAMVAGDAPPAWPIVSPRLGWAYPWGVSHGGMVGGTEIYLYDGITTAASASNDGYRLAQLAHQMYTDRQPNVLYDRSGLPTEPESWTIHDPELGPFLPIWWFNGPMLWASDPFGFSGSPHFQRDYVEQTGREPAYQQALEAFLPIDEEHLVRYTRSAKVLVWLGNDAIARDDLRAQAEGIRFTYTDLPQDRYGGVIPTGMLHARLYVDQHPHQGFFYGRAEGWGLDTMVSCYSILEPEWRQKTRAWFGKVADLVADGQAACSGIIQSTPLYNVFNGQYRCRQSIECAITENALYGMMRTVFGRSDLPHATRVRDTLVTSIYSMLSPLVWSTAQHGPYALFATGPFDLKQPPFCSFIPKSGNQGNIDSFQVWSSFAYAYELSNDPIFLTKAAELLHQPLDPGLYDDGIDNLENRAALLALIERL
jgi:hypothetical protein